jgi:hypothetical protein
MKSEPERIIHEPDIPDTNQLIVQSLAKLDAIALGISLGTLSGLAIFCATSILILKGGEEIGPTLELLNQYFIGYEVTPVGSLIGSVYGFASGFIAGWLIAILRNFIVTVYIQLLKIKGSVSAVNDFIDNP